MQYIYKDRIIHIEWSIFKGTSPVREDFSRALVKCFLVGPNEKYLLDATAEGGKLLMDIPQGLPEGAYSLETIYVKNWNSLLPVRDTITPSDAPVPHRVPRPGINPNDHNTIHPHDFRGNERSLMRSRVEYAFAITSYPTEADDTESSGEVTLPLKSSVASYGYDGLSAYEIAVLRGDFDGTESEWLEWTHERIVADVKDLLQQLKDRDTRFVVKTQSQRDNLPDIKDGDEVYVTDDAMGYVLKEENGERIWMPSDYGSVTAKYILSFIADMPNFVADRAIADEFGKRIVDEYLTRDAVRNYISEIYNDLFVKNPPYIMDGYITVDMLSDAVKQLIGFGPIVNFPDDEFLTTKGGRITLKDKDYNPNSYSGMGRRILRKNMVNGVNVLTQRMMLCPNTIYVISYDYDLRGQTITIPSRSVLLFEGGSISNGIIEGNNTILLGTLYNVLRNIDISGTWKSDFKLSYFNIPNPNYDSFKDIQKGINGVAGTCNKFIIDIDCWGSSFVYVPSNTHILFEKGVTITKIAPEGGFLVYPKDNTIGGFDVIQNVSIEGEGILDQNTRNTQDVSASFIRCYHASNIIIRDLTFKDSGNYHYIELGAVDNVTIDKCSFIGHRYITAPSLPEKQHRGECIQIEYTESLDDEVKRDYLECKNVTISNCLFDGMYHYNGETKVYDTYCKSAIGCHSDTVDNISRNPHENIVIDSNTFVNIGDICINARYMNNSKFINNRAINLKGMFIGGAFANPDLLKTYYNFDNCIIRGNEVWYDTSLTQIVEIPAISDITRKVRGAIELYGCSGTIIEENTIYNSPVHVLYIANSPKTTINANTFEGWNTIDKNNGTLSNSGRCFFVADEEITEGTVKALTSELSLSSNFIRDSYMALEVRIFYRNKESLDSTLSILGNVVEVPNGKWDLYGFSMLENTIIMNTYNRPYYPTNDQGKYYLEDGKFIVWDGEIWRNSDGTWSNRVVII